MNDHDAPPPDPRRICFGLSQELDRSSCALYLRLLGRKPLVETLTQRLSSQEIELLVDTIGSLMRRHLSEQEYHSLFLGDHEHGH